MKHTTLILDNYDSFTYNLYQYLAELGGNPVVYRNDEITLEEIKKLNPTHIVISPGPGTPENRRDFGVCAEVIREMTDTPILGVCLGHQGIIHVFGGKIVRAPEIVHGKQSEMRVRSHCGLFKNLPQRFEAMRYHSLIGDRETIPEELEITAETAKDKLVMAVQHRKRPLYGIQFHPESIGTPLGKKILANFLASGNTNESAGLEDSPEAMFGAATRNMFEKKTIKGSQRKSNERRARMRKKYADERVVAEGEDSQAGASVKFSPLSRQQAANIMKKMMSGEMNDDEMARILIEMAERGETVDEIAGMAEVMRDKSLRVNASEAFDCCGTGGSGLPRINTSTMVAFIVAASGVQVAKHGNRASGGRCGSFDVLEALGAKIELSPKQVEKTMAELGIGFMFAPLFHPAMRYVAPVRKRIQRRTVFNILGPLTNPAHVKKQLIGTTNRQTAEKMIKVLKSLGHTRALVATGSDGLDELTLAGPSTLFILNKGRITEQTIAPEDVGLKRAAAGEIQGGDSAKNARVFKEILENRVRGPLCDLVLLNAGAALFAADAVPTVDAGVKKAREILESGKAGDLLARYIILSNSKKLK